jgi:hypothetical protein
VPKRARARRRQLDDLLAPVGTGCSRLVHLDHTCGCDSTTTVNLPLGVFEPPAPTIAQLGRLVERVDVTHPHWPAAREAVTAALEGDALADDAVRRDLAARLRALPTTPLPADTYSGLDDE